MIYINSLVLINIFYLQIIWRIPTDKMAIRSWRIFAVTLFAIHISAVDPTGIYLVISYKFIPN